MLIRFPLYSGFRILISLLTLILSVWFGLEVRCWANCFRWLFTFYPALECPLDCCWRDRVSGWFHKYPNLSGRIGSRHTNVECEWDASCGNVSSIKFCSWQFYCTWREPDCSGLWNRRRVNLTVFTLGTTSVSVQYDTQYLTSKDAEVWTFLVDSPYNITVLLPEESTIVYLSEMPASIDTDGSKITLSLFPSQMGDKLRLFINSARRIPNQRSWGHANWG